MPEDAWRVLMAFAFVADDDGRAQVTDEGLTATVNMLIETGFFDAEDARERDA